jgi:hypothetical protein
MEEKITIKLKPLHINEDGVDNIELWNKINQIIFVLNELNIKIYSTDAEALNKWKDILEENK